MVDSKQFEFVAIQTAVFTPDHDEFKSAKLLTAVFKSFSDRFQGQLQALPIPGEVPPEIPRVTLQSPDKTWKVEAGPARISSLWNRQKGDEEPDFFNVVARCSEIQEAYVRETGVRAGRLGLIVTRVCRVDNPAQVLIGRFCSAESRNESFNRSASFEIHNHKEYAPQRAGLNWRINSWVRCKTAASQEDAGPMIVVQQDLNTLASEIQEHRFGPEEIQTFFQATAAESDEIFGKYFPG